MFDPIIFTATVSPIIIVVLILFSCLLFYRLHQLKKKYNPIIDMDAEVQRAKRELEAISNFNESLRKQIATGQSCISNMKKEISLLEENLEDISYGLYKPHFTFATSEIYKLKLEEIWKREKNLIKNGEAVVCSTKWTVGGSEKEGAKMAKQNMKLILRAFNGECDAAVAKVSWNNVSKMEERIRKSYETVNSLGQVLNVSITLEYLSAKIDEIRCTYEYEEKKHAEIEEQRRIREEMREEEKAQRELENARLAAEKEEARYQKALEMAREEAEHASGERMSKLNEQIRILEEKLRDAQAQKQRAISQAQLTKSGNIYVISNIGSFGEDVYKIGMTRRLDPMDRVRELGDASVPFPFDVHAIIYTENAPKMELDLHNQFREKSVNLVNMRKEFFKVPLTDIEKYARKLGCKVEFTKLAEAREFRESCSARGNKIAPPALMSENTFDNEGDLVVQASDLA